MCGITLIVTGVSIRGGPFSSTHSDSAVTDTQQQSYAPTAAEFQEMLSHRGPDGVREDVVEVAPRAVLRFLGSLLQIRGGAPTTLPLTASGNVLIFNGEIFGGVEVPPEENDTAVLLAALERAEAAADPPAEVVRILSDVEGPWAVVYWQASSQTLFYGRDHVGRRSLLLHRPSPGDPRLILSSAAPTSGPPPPEPAARPAPAEDEAERPERAAAGPPSDPATTGGPDSSEAPCSPGLPQYWEEVRPGLYSITFPRQPHSQVDGAESAGTAATTEGSEVGVVEGWARQYPHVSAHKHAICDQQRSGEEATRPAPDTVDQSLQAQEEACAVFLEMLDRSVRTRVLSCRAAAQPAPAAGAGGVRDAPLLVLFSGGVDSMLLAALADRHVAPHEPIDLATVCFAKGASPDRQTALAGWKELQALAPHRRWRLIRVDGDLDADVTANQQRLETLLHPSSTYMDLNIGAALWLAAGAAGVVACSGADCEFCRAEGKPPSERRGDAEGEEAQREHEYRSAARVVLLGSGADEQCGGYGRHRTAFRNGGWEGLAAELRLDVQRIWARNLGRDDRLVSDRSREARFPFLDEAVMAALLRMPLWAVCDPRQGQGVGDKCVIRKAAAAIGLSSAALRPKRAIQFGSRIAKQSNVRNFGSNNQANKANAGSVKFEKVSSS